MSTQTDAGATFAPQAAMPASASQARPYFWSVRREVWENRAIWIAPLAAAGFVLLGFTISLVRRPHGFDKLSKAPPDVQAAFHLIPYGISILAILITAAIVALFYCLGALYNERRDRSILFWKSMPVSDLTTVLAKASVPLILLPVIAVLVICATQIVMLALSAGAALVNTSGSTPLWASVPLLRIWGLLIYGVVALALWNAPIYGWLLVISASVRRGPFLWAILPPFAIALVEKLAFVTSYFADLVNYRLRGGIEAAFVSVPHHHGKMNFAWPQPDPVKFLSTPGLWFGLLAAAALVALAVWLRRRREPM
jgi:ABC-2 type transport system permease protein